MNPRKPIVVLVIILIVMTGIFKNYVGLFYSIPIEWTFDVLGLDYQGLVDKAGVLAQDGKADFGLGAILYYPTYLFLHFVLIYFLFPKNPVLRKWLMTGLFVTLLSLGLIVSFSKIYEIEWLDTISQKIFDNLAGRPLVLFLVEGGGLLYEYVDQKLS